MNSYKEQVQKTAKVTAKNLKWYLYFRHSSLKVDRQKEYWGKLELSSFSASKDGHMWPPGQLVMQGGDSDMVHIFFPERFLFSY